MVTRVFELTVRLDLNVDSSLYDNCLQNFALSIKHNRFHTCIVTCPFVFIYIYQDTVRLLIPHLISNQRGRAV